MSEAAFPYGAFDLTFSGDYNEIRTDDQYIFHIVPHVITKSRVRLCFEIDSDNFGQFIEPWRTCGKGQPL